MHNPRLGAERVHGGKVGANEGAKVFYFIDLGERCGRETAVVMRIKLRLVCQWVSLEIANLCTTPVEYGGVETTRGPYC